ncbi:MAG: transglycosylase domain-containing protein [Prevotella sp.]|nr:transglycosylase domain-containing protein [Prevotella sp.]
MMKRKKKIPVTLCIVSVILIIGLFSFIKFGGYFLIDKADREEYIAEIKNSTELPDRFYEIYNIIFPDALETNSWMYLFNREFGKAYNQCPCREAAYEGWYLRHIGFDMTLLTNLTENYASQKECLNYYAAQKEFPNKIIGVHNASAQYFDKKITALNDAELIELILMMQNPYFYNKKRRPEVTQARVDYILDKLNNS